MVFSRKFFYILFCMIFLASCEKSYIDEDSKITRKDFQDTIINGYDTDKGFLGASSKQTPPNISKLLVSPPPPPMGNGELISFSVTEDVPLKDVLIELGRVANIDVEIDPNIRGGIILKASNKPLDIIVKRICELGGLRYSYTNNILRFTIDTPYTVTYNMDFLSDSEIWGTVESALNDLITINKSKSQMSITQSTDNNQTSSNLPSSTQSQTTDESKIIINKPAGMITVYANEKTQKAVADYISNVRMNYGAQVLIEAKVVSVTLKKEHSMGIDWSFINDSTTATSGTTTTTTVTNGAYIGNTPAISNSSGGFSAIIPTAIFGGNLTAAVNALDSFGMTKTLSSPRVHAMNNQKAELKFVKKLIYFTIENDQSTSSSSSSSVVTTTSNSTKQEEEVGVTLTITPSIDLRKNEVTLNVVPELKAQNGSVVDPVNKLNEVPIIETRSVDTSVKVRSGGILVIGGLMENNTENNDKGVPFLSGIPVLGYLFKSSTRNKKITETVIFLKATIIKPDGQAITPYDRGIYNKFIKNNDNFM